MYVIRARDEVDMVPYSLTLMLAANLCVFLGAAVQGSTGIGFALVAAPLLLLLDTSLAPVPIILSTFVLSSLMSIKDRKHIHFAGIRYALIGYIPGAIGAGAIVHVLSAEILELVFAATLLLAATITAAGFTVRPKPTTNLAAGGASGLMGTISSIGGPPMGLLYQHEAGGTVRGTLGGMAVVGSFISICVHATIGGVGSRELSSFAVMSPGVIVGFLTSSYLSKILDRGYLRPSIVALSLLAAVYIVIARLV